MKRVIQKSTMADTIGLLEAFEEFIEEKEAQNKSPKTIHNYRQTFEAFCKFNEFDRNTEILESKPLRAKCSLIGSTIWHRTNHRSQ